MDIERRSGCPINLTMEVLGDRWSLVVIRDIMFGNNKIISNCTTHFYGKMNSPATIEATPELMAAKGGSGADIASMRAGEFYFTTEGMAEPEKVRTPLCLSHHPQNPLGQEDVVKRARACCMAA